ncbi:MAG: DNA primase [Patescibacteria group bacterium]|nr:DNA primase [Patescibacteria group bacterium]
MEAADEIKSRLDIADVVGEYLQLKPAGSGSFKANCPFHQEKTPSFYVNRPRQSWHCFGCNIGGDMISFVQQIEGMEFMEALEHLAQKAGVQLPSYNPETQGLKKCLQEVNDVVAKLMQQYLINDPEAASAREYVKKRGIDDLTADLWRLGYAPKDWSKFEKKLYEKGFTAQELIQAGVASPSERGQGIYFRFRERLMFPICEAMGHIVGFTGRILSAEKVAKYVNTPETTLYKKSAVLYGLDKAKGDIKRDDLAIIVEGNMDALTSHQFGVTNVVASSGTALTQEQLTLIKRYSNNIAIAFDMDPAGLNATLRGLDLARQMDFSIHVIRFDQSLAKDPDELIRKDVQLWKEAVRTAKPIMDWVYQQAFMQFPSSTPEGKKQIAQFVLNECKHISHPVERDAWVSKLAKDLDVSPEALRQTLSQNAQRETRNANFETKFNIQRSGQTAKRTNSEADIRDSRPSTVNELEARWLSIVLKDPSLFHEIDIDWSQTPHAELYKSLVQSYNSRHQNQTAEENNPPDFKALYSLDNEETKRLVDYLVIFADREFTDQTADALKSELTATEIRLHELSLNGRRQQLEQEMRTAERLGDTERINALLEQFKQLK